MMGDSSVVTKAERPHLLGLDRQSLAELLRSWGESPFRANQILQWLHTRQVTDFAAMTNISKALRARLAAETCINEPEIIADQLAADRTRKWLLGLLDGNAIETVFIPEEDRGTLCISSQVGCSLACSFCATGAQGLSRNLETHEIIAQVRVARRFLGLDAITNIVFMGMGEPLLNLRQVLPALDLLRDDYAYGFGARRITVSTAGVVPGMDRLGTESPVNLAISLHASKPPLPAGGVARCLPPLSLAAPTPHHLRICDAGWYQRCRHPCPGTSPLTARHPCYGKFNPL